MSSKTRIIVLHMKEVVYTIAFLILAILLGILIYFMFGPGKSQTTSAKADGIYTPGVYRSSIRLNQNTFRCGSNRKPEPHPVYRAGQFKRKHHCYVSTGETLPGIPCQPDRKQSIS